jgi:CheY-like chemotaxis protein
VLFLLDTHLNYLPPPTKNFITTPLKRSELKKYANQIINLKNISSEKPALSHHKKDLNDLKGKILLVDDSEDSRLLIKIFLKSSKLDLEIAENGIDGLKKFKEKDYDIILMDVQMPEMDGLSCTKKIREFESEHPQKRKTYILAMTAYAFNEDIRKTKEAGCNDHISKPINKGKLIKSIKNYLKY